MWVVQCLCIYFSDCCAKNEWSFCSLLWPKKFRCAAAAASFFCSPKNEGQMYPCQLSKCQVVSVTEPLTTFAAVYVVAQLCHVVLNSTLDLHSIEVNMNPILWGDYTKYLWKYISSVVSAYLGNTSTFAVLFIFFYKEKSKDSKIFLGPNHE